MCARSSGVSWVKSGIAEAVSFQRSRDQPVDRSAARLSSMYYSPVCSEYCSAVSSCSTSLGVFGANLDHPASFVRIVVDALRLIDQRAVDFDDFAGRRARTGRTRS